MPLNTNNNTNYDETFFKKLRDNVSLVYKDIEMPGGYTWNHMETLKGIELAYNSRFKKGDKDKLNLRKFFFNIVKTPVDVAEKFTDLDTKDFIFIPELMGHERKVMLFQKDFKLWTKQHGWGFLINELGHNRPKYGSVVAKKVGKKVKQVNVHNLRLDPTAESLQSSGFIYEAIMMGRHEVEAMPWEHKSKLLERDGDKFLVYECYHRKGNGWKRIFVGDLFCHAKNGKMEHSVESFINQEYALPPLVLGEDTVKILPYKESHWEKLPGRWLGFGFVEYLLENQIATNEAENLERRSLQYGALKLFQTRDQSMGGKNVLTSAKNGDILQVDSEVTPIAMEERNLPQYNSTRERWDQNSSRKTFSTEITTGSNLPSRTPLGVANMQASMIESFYEKKREDFGLFLKEVLFDFVIPSFKDMSRLEHSIAYLGSDEDAEKLDNAIVDAYIGKALEKYVGSTGWMPSAAQIAMRREEMIATLKSRSSRSIKIPDDFYTDARFFMDIEVTGEGMDTSVRSQLLMTAMQFLNGNPQALSNPAIREMFFRFMALGGITLAELGIDTSKFDQMPTAQMGQGGSLSVPGTPSPMAQSKQL